MPKKQVNVTKEPERAVLVAVERKGKPFDQDLQELQELVYTAGAETVCIVSQKRDNPSPSTYLGTGKVQEVKEAAIAEQAEVVIVDDELTPVQQRNLTEQLERRVLDRTQLILDIFAQRARTSEGKLQVELAQLRYLLPRLSSLYTKFERQQGGIGTRGPGETKLESDRRRIRVRIQSVQKEIDQVRQRRSQLRERRHKQSVPTVALV
ncbi:MAG: GTPase HflX, partial [Actinomycetota bacterium]